MLKNTLQDIGTQLWGDRVPVNGEIYANKPVCIEPNIELLEFLEREQNPKGVPLEIQQISEMVETVLLVDSLAELIGIIGDDGKTSLGDGKRVKKNHVIIDTLGELDNLNAVIGWAEVSSSSKKYSKD